MHADGTAGSSNLPWLTSDGGTGGEIGDGLAVALELEPGDLARPADRGTMAPSANEMRRKVKEAILRSRNNERLRKLNGFQAKATD